MHLDGTSRLCCLLAAALLLASGADSRAQQPKPGLAVGEVIPVSIMSCVVGKWKTACLSLLHREHRTVSVYIRGVEEARLEALLQKINAVLTNKDDLYGYVVVMQSDPADEELKSRLRDWATQRGLTKLDWALLNPKEDPSLRYGIEKGTGVVVVYADKRQVKQNWTFPAGKLDESAIHRLATTIEELAR